MAVGRGEVQAAGEVAQPVDHAVGGHGVRGGVGGHHGVAHGAGAVPGPEVVRNGAVGADPAGGNEAHHFVHILEKIAGFGGGGGRWLHRDEDSLGPGDGVLRLFQAGHATFWAKFGLYHVPACPSALPLSH